MTRETAARDVKDTLWTLTATIATAMLTLNRNGVLRARPMRGHQEPSTGTIWFFARKSAYPELAGGSAAAANVAYADPKDEHYVSISGTAGIVHDRDKMKELWTPFVSAWFEGGLDDPDLTLIKVDAEEAEFWDAPASKAVQLWRLTKSQISGERPDMGENEKVDLR